MTPDNVLTSHNQIINTYNDNGQLATTRDRRSNLTELQ